MFLNFVYKYGLQNIASHIYNFNGLVSKLKNAFYGIDIGGKTTKIARLFVDSDGVHINKICDDNSQPFLSMIAISKKDNTFVFGNQVIEDGLYLSKDYEIITSIKIFLETKSLVIINNKQYTSSQIVGFFLKYIKDYLYQKNNITILEATYAISNNYSLKARKALKKASEFAGIKLNGFIYNNTATFISNIDESEENENVVVIDWGHYCFNASVVGIKANRVYEISKVQLNLGGAYINYEFAKCVHSIIQEKTKIDVGFDEMSIENQNKLIFECDNLKQTLTNIDSAELELKDYGTFGTIEILINQNIFFELVNPIIQHNIKYTLDKVIEKSDLILDQVEKVIICGDSCYIKPFVEFIEENYFKSKPITYVKNLSCSVGASIVDQSTNNCFLNEQLSVLLSDGNKFRLLEESKIEVGTFLEPISFFLSDSSYKANFIFLDGNNRVLDILSIDTESTLNEKIYLRVRVHNMLFVEIKILNPSLVTNNIKVLELPNLNYVYSFD